MMTLGFKGLKVILTNSGITKIVCMIIEQTSTELHGSRSEVVNNKRIVECVYS